MDDSMLLCARTATMPEEVATPGSIKQWCSFCAEEVWLSVDGQRFAEEMPSLKLVCTECAIGLMAQEDREIPLEGIPGASDVLGPHAKAFATYVLRQLVREKRAEQ